MKRAVTNIISEILWRMGDLPPERGVDEHIQSQLMELHETAHFWSQIRSFLAPHDPQRLERGWLPKELTEFFEVRTSLRDVPEQMERMRVYLGVPSLSFPIWFELHQAFSKVLKSAQGTDNMDEVVIAMTKFLVRQLGQAREPEGCYKKPLLDLTSIPDEYLHELDEDLYKWYSEESLIDDDLNVVRERISRMAYGLLSWAFWPFHLPERLSALPLGSASLFELPSSEPLWMTC